MPGSDAIASSYAAFARANSFLLKCSFPRAFAASAGVVAVVAGVGVFFFLSNENAFVVGFSAEAALVLVLVLVLVVVLGSVSALFPFSSR
eukprot:31022-Pelagococcus_subviridis.AAC.5